MDHFGPIPGGFGRDFGHLGLFQGLVPDFGPISEDLCLHLDRFWPVSAILGQFPRIWPGFRPFWAYFKLSGPRFGPFWACFGGLGRDFGFFRVSFRMYGLEFVLIRGIWASRSGVPPPQLLSHASEVGSPTNHLGCGQRRDTGQGPFKEL